MKTCKICGSKIDRGECGVDHTVITFVKDSHNLIQANPTPVKRIRHYLCHQCTSNLEYFLEYLDEWGLDKLVLAGYKKPEKEGVY